MRETRRSTIRGRTANPSMENIKRATTKLLVRAKKADTYLYHAGIELSELDKNAISWGIDHVMIQMHGYKFEDMLEKTLRSIDDSSKKVAKLREYLTDLLED